MNDKAEKAYKVAQLVDKLPPMPENISRLMASEADLEHQYSQVHDLIENDPGLCADLLHLAIDSGAGSGKNAETVDDAIELIGITPLIQFIGVSYVNKVILKEFAILEHMHDYFEHSRCISLSARILAELSGASRHQCEMFAVMGLIHDIGRLIIALAGNKLSTPLMGTTWNKMLSIVHNEKEILGLDHSEVGMQICSKWHFSPVLQEGILRHHRPLINGDLSFPGARIFISHFVSFSDLTGEILSNMLSGELMSNLHLAKSDLEKAQKIFELRYRDHNHSPRAFSV